MSLTSATPNLLTDPGFLFWAPIGSSLPTNTVAGSVFTDTWPVAWIQLGMTQEGSSLKQSLEVQPIEAAESLEPIAYRSTSRTGQITFMLKSFTATNLQRALNGATATVTGSTTTTLTQIDPPAIGSETRCMIGYESQDATVRWVGFQCINSGDVEMTFAKAPSNTNLPFTLVLEKPTSTQAFRLWTAGVARA